MDEYGQLLFYFSGRIREALERLPPAERSQVREIRLRTGKPPALIFRDRVQFLGTGPVSSGEISACLQRVCGYSMQSCGEELKQGFFTLPGGHRVGIAGTAAAEGGEILSLREAGSLNFRIARQIFGAAGTLPAELYGGGKRPSVLIAGPPGSGKTTVLRDLIRRLSMGECGRPVQIAAVDERGELGGGMGEASLDLGPCTDLLRGCPKGAGMEIALRTLSPQVIACDELGSVREAEAVLESLYGGVSVLATAHGDSMESLARRPVLVKLLENHAFDVAVFLRNGIAAEIVRLEERQGE